MIKVKGRIVSAILFTAILIFVSSIVNVQDPYSYPKNLFLENLSPSATYTIKTNGSNCWAVNYDDNISYHSTNASYGKISLARDVRFTPTFNSTRKHMYIF